MRCMRELTLRLFSLLFVISVGACAHPGFRVVVQNDDPSVSLVRFSFEGGYADFVYEVPPGTIGSARQGNDEWRGIVEFLTDDCTVVASMSLRALGDVLVQQSPSGPVAASSFLPGAELRPLTETARCVRS